jgi:PAS domain-containing protein
MMRLRAMLLLPLGLFVLFWIVYLVAVGDIGPVSLFSLLALLLVGLTLTNTELLVLRPLRGLIRAAQDLAQNRYSGPPAKASPAPMRELAAGLDRLRDRMHVYEAKLAQERTRRQALEQSVRELEDRYALTVERANDGIWEWNLQSGAVDFSLRWKALLGRTNAHMGHIEDWRKLLH